MADHPIPKLSKTEAQTENAPFRPDWMVLAGFGVLLILSAGLFFEVIEDLIEGDPLIWSDAAIYGGLQALRSQGLDRLMILITELGDTPVVIAVTTAVGLWLIHQKAWRTLSFWLLAVAGGSGINTAIKAVMRRARPGDMHYEGWSAFSFPSGHSTTNAVLYGFLAIILVRFLPLKWGVSVIVAVVSLVGLIAFSRLYLGAHWLSDVAGGLGFGTMWLMVLGAVYIWRRPEPVNPRALMIVAAVTLGVAGAVNIALSYQGDLKRYAPRTCCVAPDAKRLPSLPPNLPDVPTR